MLEETIKLSTETKKKLDDLGNKKDTYENIIIKLLNNQKQQTA